jgi:hypothetical protein
MWKVSRDSLIPLCARVLCCCCQTLRHVISKQPLRLRRLPCGYRGTQRWLIRFYHCFCFISIRCPASRRWGTGVLSAKVLRCVQSVLIIFVQSVPLCPLPPCLATRHAATPRSQPAEATPTRSHTSLLLLRSLLFRCKSFRPHPRSVPPRRCCCCSRPPCG